MIQPLNGPKLWSKTGLVPPFPPVYHKPPGRPPTCRRDQMNLPILPKSWGHNYRSCKNLPNREYQLKNKPRWKSLGYIRKKGWINIIPSISTNGNTKCNPNTNTNGNTKSSFGHSKRSFSNSKGTKSICIKGKVTSTKGNFCSNGNSNKRGKSNTNSNKCNNNKGGIITNI